jgi:hypothetical protein
MLRTFSLELLLSYAVEHFEQFAEYGIIQLNGVGSRGGGLVLYQIANVIRFGF